MANRNFSKNVNTLFNSLVIISGQININAGGTVASHTIRGAVSVVRTSAGIYTITLKDPYVGLASCSVNISTVTNQGIFPQFGAIDVVNAKTVVIKTSSSGGTPFDADNACTINVTLFLNNSKVK